MTWDEVRDAVSRAHSWRRAHGNAAFETPLARFVVDPAHPWVWDANHVDRVRAATGAEIDALLAEMETRFAHTPYRVAVTDDFTPSGFVARIAFDDYREQAPLLQMALVDAPTPVAAADADLREVVDDQDWGDLWRLVERDFAEGARSRGVDVSAEVARGLFDGYRAKREVAPFFLARVDGVAVAYGSVIECPGELGAIDDVFTAPEFRRRGIASAIVALGVARLRARGRPVVYIGALASEQPKRLYAKLGFAPLMVVRTWVKKVGRGADQD